MAKKKYANFTESRWKVASSIFILKILFFLNAAGLTAEAMAQLETDSQAAAPGAGIGAGVEEEARRLREQLRQAEEKIRSLEEKQRTDSEELRVLRGEFVEMTAEYLRRTQEYGRLALSVSATLQSGELTGMAANEEETVKALFAVTESGRRLTAGAVQLCEYLNSVLNQLPLDQLQKVRIQYRIDDLKKEAERFEKLIVPPEALKRVDNCRILAVNKKLQVIVLDVGSFHGVRCGLVWTFETRPHFRSVVVAVRPFVSAAVLVEGDIDDLGPGMLAGTGSGND